jgi:hypothetical protein
MSEMSEESVKSIVVSMLKGFNAKINEGIENNVIAPVTKVINDIKEIKKRMADIEAKHSVPQDPAPKQDNPEPVISFDNLIDASINVIPTHVEETMRFVLFALQLVDGKKDMVPKDVVESIIEEYGENGGKRLSASLASALKDSKRKKIKESWDGIMSVFNSER